MATSDETVEQLITTPGAKVVNIADPDIPWHDYLDKLPGETTPDHVAKAKHAVLYSSPDGKVTLGAWSRDEDYGPIGSPGWSFDIVLEGSVTLINTDGTEQTAGPGEVILYRREDVAEWHQTGYLRKFYVTIEE